MLWGHLVSDTSLEELHEAAARIGLHPRSFDLDHYDWPAAQRADLLAPGVQLVDSHTLTRALIGSGLRIPARDRATVQTARTRADAARLGIDGEDPALRALILGPVGHVDLLPDAAGAFRISRDAHGGRPRLQSRDMAGAEAARAWLGRADALSRAHGHADFVGQVLVVPAGR